MSLNKQQVERLNLLKDSADLVSSACQNVLAYGYNGRYASSVNPSNKERFEYALGNLGAIIRLLEESEDIDGATCEASMDIKLMWLQERKYLKSETKENKCQ